MRDLFGDPILLIPVIIILTIFGIGYVGFMIWAYNRDAKKQGKKSGCLPVILLLLFVLFVEFANTIMQS
jgi:flagellar basal body-associated protein FliL